MNGVTSFVMLYLLVPWLFVCPLKLMTDRRGADLQSMNGTLDWNINEEVGHLLGSLSFACVTGKKKSSLEIFHNYSTNNYIETSKKHKIGSIIIPVAAFLKSPLTYNFGLGSVKWICCKYKPRACFLISSSLCWGVKNITASRGC